MVGIVLICLWYTRIVIIIIIIIIVLGENGVEYDFKTVNAYWIYKHLI